MTFTFQPVPYAQDLVYRHSTEEQKQHETEIEYNLSQAGSSREKDKILRPKKNVESNISNQVFSYITNKHKSIKELRKIMKENSEKTDLYY